jgi:spore maturation protein SpmA
MLNIIWALLIVFSVLASCIHLALGNTDIVNSMMESFFSSADSAVKISIGLSGLLCAWLGVCRVMEAVGIMDLIARVLSPLFRAIMPDVPAGSRAISSVTMNLSANMLGLDNAATPLGIRAMKDLQEVNPSRDTASNAQIMFLVLNTSSVCLFPVTVFLYRAQFGASSPAEVFVPIILATSVSTITGFLVTALVQKIPLFRIPVMITFAVLMAVIASVVAWGIYAGTNLSEQSKLVANLILMLLIGSVFAFSMLKRVKTFEVFVSGAREGFDTALQILPFLVAMLFAIGFFRASGALDFILDLIRYVSSAVFSDIRFVDAIPVAIAKPLSGSGARAMMIDVINAYGVDSFQGKLSTVMQGSTETTFYVIAVYFGSVGISKVRHAIACGLAADFAAMIASVCLSYYFFG